MYKFNHDNFIRSNVISLEVNEQSIPHNDFIEFKKFIEHDFAIDSDKLHFKNDDWIIDIDRKLKEYSD